MSTIKELAETCGVSEQAIRKWCARNQVAKDVAQRYIIDKTTETAILQHYGKDTRNQVAQPTETSCETSETMKEIIEMLRKELEAKDKQIESLQNSLDRTTAALVSAQESLTLPTAKAGGFLFLPPLHWQIPYGTAMSYTVSTGYIYTVPACPAVQFSYLYADCSCSPFFKILMPAFVSRS